MPTRVWGESDDLIEVECTETKYSDEWGCVDEWRYVVLDTGDVARVRWGDNGMEAETVVDATGGAAVTVEPYHPVGDSRHDPEDTRPVITFSGNATDAVILEQDYIDGDLDGLANKLDRVDWNRMPGERLLVVYSAVVGVDLAKAIDRIVHAQVKPTVLQEPPKC